MAGTTISRWIADLGIWPLIVLLLPNVFLFRRHGQESSRKRIASLLQAIAVFLFTMAAASIVELGLNDYYLLLALAILGVASWFLRKRMFPYRLACPRCGKKHQFLTTGFTNVYVMDDDLCDDCREAARSEEENAGEDDDD